MQNWKKGDRVRLMDQYRGVVEVGRGTIHERPDPMRGHVIVCPDFNPGARISVCVFHEGLLQPLGDNRLRRWAA